MKNHPSTQTVDTILEISQFLYLKHIPFQQALLLYAEGLLTTLGREEDGEFHGRRERGISKFLQTWSFGNILLQAWGENTLKPLTLWERLKGNSWRLGMSLVQLNAYKAWVTFFYLQSKYTESSDTLKEAQKQFLEIGSVLGAAQCLQSLGNILRTCSSNTPKPLTALREAQGQFLEIGSAIGVAQCLQRSGDILHMQSKYTEASDTLREAQAKFLEIGSSPWCSSMLTKLGWHSSTCRSKYTKASDTLREAQTQFLEIGSIHGAAQCLQSLKHSLACRIDTPKLQTLWKRLKSYSWRLALLLMQLNAHKAWATFFTWMITTLKPLTLWERLKGNSWRLGMSLVQLNAYKALGDILCMQDKYTEASQHSERS